MSDKKREQKDEGPTMAVRVGAAALTLAAGWVAQRAVNVAWKRVSGKPAPKNADDPDVSIAAAVAFAAVAAGVGALARRLASRNAHRIVGRMASKRSD